MIAQLLKLLAVLTADPRASTDDTWDCYIDGSNVAVCERVVSPCRWRLDPAECTLQLPWSVTLPDGTVCNLNDPLGCLPESDATP